MKRYFVLLLVLVMVLSGCTMEETIPGQTEAYTLYYNNESLYLDAIEYLKGKGENCLISRTDYFSPAGSEDFTGLYVQSMDSQEFHEETNHGIQLLFETTEVKLIDYLVVDSLVICTFDLCIPSKNYDYGFYYVSEDKPIYLGDPAIDLTENGRGYSYEQSASYGVKFTFYTEKIKDNIYYYEIM